MASLPPFNESGDLPVGVHPVTLRDAIDHLGTLSPQRMLIAFRLERIYQVAMATGQVARFIVFGSFITAKTHPNDVDIFLLMEDTFDLSVLSGEAALLFDHLPAQAHFGASVFWLRRQAAFGGEQATIEYWQVKRGGDQRGIVEIVQEQP